MYGAIKIGVMLGPIRAIEVASTSTKVSDPARNELEAPTVSSIRAMLGDGVASSPTAAKLRRPSAGRTGHEISPRPPRHRCGCYRGILTNCRAAGYRDGLRAGPSRYVL